MGTHSSPVVFVTLAGSVEDTRRIPLLLDSIRTFAGEYSECPVWVFQENSARGRLEDIKDSITRVIPLEIPMDLPTYWFTGKTVACCTAEEMANDMFGSLIWVASDCLIVNPPVLMDLQGEYDAAFRPVHVRNAGLPVDEPPDCFWSGIYRAAGIDDVDSWVESFVDMQKIRSYFNTHSFSVKPSRGLMRKWMDLFRELVKDRLFQNECCAGQMHRIFLHQAVLSTLIARDVPRDKLLLLPEDYCYPFNLNESVPVEKRAQTMNELVSFAYERRSLDPESITDIIVEEPLFSWLS